MDPTVAQWIIGGLFGVVVALIGVIYANHTKEINKLREWRHSVVDPALRLTGWLEDRVDKLEERERRRHGSGGGERTAARRRKDDE